MEDRRPMMGSPSVRRGRYGGNDDGAARRARVASLERTHREEAPRSQRLGIETKGLALGAAVAAAAFYAGWQRPFSTWGPTASAAARLVSRSVGDSPRSWLAACGGLVGAVACMAPSTAGDMPDGTFCGGAHGFLVLGLAPARTLICAAAFVMATRGLVVRALRNRLAERDASALVECSYAAGAIVALGAVALSALVTVWAGGSAHRRQSHRCRRRRQERTPRIGGRRCARGDDRSPAPSASHAPESMPLLDNDDGERDGAGADGGCLSPVAVEPCRDASRRCTRDVFKRAAELGIPVYCDASSPDLTSYYRLDVESVADAHGDGDDDSAGADGDKGEQQRSADWASF